MNFQIMRQVEGKQFYPAFDENHNALIFNCPKKAAQEAKKLSDRLGFKFQPRPVVETDDTWKARELKRFETGAYRPVPWHGQEWWDKNHNPDHFIHVLLKDATKIAFTKNAKDGVADIQTSMKPGKYLAEFFKDILTTEEIKAYSMDHTTTFENKELKFATTPEEIERSYKPTLGYSCFSGTKKANLYGSGDFAVAYIEKDGEITGRAVCAPERKIFARPYGDDYRIRKLLNDMGYTESNYYNHDDEAKWRGLRLLAEHYWSGFYTDFGGKAVPHPTDKKYYVIA